MAMPSAQDAAWTGEPGSPFKRDKSKVLERPLSGTSTVATSSDLKPSLKPGLTQDSLFSGNGCVVGATVESDEKKSFTTEENIDTATVETRSGSDGEAIVDQSSLTATKRQALVSELEKIQQGDISCAGVLELLDIWGRDAEGSVDAVASLAALGGADPKHLHDYVRDLVATGAGKQVVPQLAQAVVEQEGEGAALVEQVLMDISDVAKTASGGYIIHREQVTEVKSGGGLELALEASIGLGAALRARNASLRGQMQDYLHRE